MAPFRSFAAAALLFASAANAHFELKMPSPLEGDKMDESLEPTAPCGGGMADLSQNTATDFHVDGDAVAVFLGHPQANFLVRATLDSKAAGNWTQLLPTFMQSGRGDLCEPAVTAPKEWAGKKGFISVVCAAPDGFLYQCAAVNFVEGSNTAPSSCANGSAVSVNYKDDPELTALLDDSTATAPAPTATGSGNSAASLIARGSSGLPIGSLAVTALMVLAGAALL